MFLFCLYHLSCKLFSSFRGAALTALQTLIESLNSENVNAQREAATELVCHSELNLAVEAIFETIDSEDEILTETLNGCLENLEDLSSVPAETIGAFLPANRKELGEQASYWAATLLGRKGAESKDQVSAIVRSISVTQFDSAKHRMVWALGKIGGDAKEALTELEGLTQSSDDRLARLAARSIESITG